MKEYTSDKIRNISMVSHSGVGKTILADAFLFATGVINRMGSVTEGSTVSDFDEEEQRRQLSLSTSIIPVEYGGYKINLLDTPGYPDFVGEVISALSVSEGALIVVDSISGLQVGTEIAWNYCDESNLPRLVVINRMKRENANWKSAIESVQKLTDKRLLKFQLPMNEKEAFAGVIDLLEMKAYLAGADSGVVIPEEFSAEAEAAHSELVEAAAEGDDALMEKYFEDGELTADEIVQGLKAAVSQGLFVPVLFADAETMAGIKQILDVMIKMIPSPVELPALKVKGVQGEEELPVSDAGPLAAYVWKTTADPFVGKITFFKLYSSVIQADNKVWNSNKEVEERMANLSVMRGKEQINVKNIHAGDIATVLKLNETATGDTLCDKGHPVTITQTEFPSALYRVAVSPRTQQDASKMGQTLTRICDEDMTLSWKNDSITKETILQGLGGQHIDVAIRKAEGKFQVGLDIRPPRIPYQETVTRKSEGQHRHKKQSGGSGQFGDVTIRIEPLPNENFEFANEVVGGAVSSNYMPAIEKGIKSVMELGVIAGYPVKNIKVAVIDGKEHPVDSKPVAFEVAGREAFKKAVRQAGAVLLEPIMDVKVTVPEDNMGDVLGDMNSRRARVQGMDTEKGRSVINAKVPLAEMSSYISDLRSFTGGRGLFTVDESHYERVPAHSQEEIVPAKVKADEEEND